MNAGAQVLPAAVTKERFPAAPLLALLVLNLFVYVPLVISIPNLITDDYVNYGLIAQHPQHLFSHNPNDYFLLFSRPLSYFSFWIDIHLWNGSGVGGKLFSLGIHLLTIALVYAFLFISTRLLHVKFDRVLAALALGLFSIHPDNIFWIIWISQRTELLMIFFYVLSLCLLARFIQDPKNRKGLIIVSAVCFVFSIASKQQSLHLPLITLLFLVFFRDQVPIERRLPLVIFSMVTGLVAIAFSVAIFMLYSGWWEHFQVEWIWSRKMFALVGTLWFVVFPLGSETVYRFFMTHQQLALVLAILASVGVVIAWRKLTRFHLYILFWAILVAVSFYPRAASPGGGRINSVQIFWFVVLTFFFFSSVRLGQKRRLFTVSLLIFLDAAATRSAMIESRNYQRARDIQVEELAEFVSESGHRTLIVVGESSHTLPFEVYYKTHGTFGNSPIESAPFWYEVMAFNRMRRFLGEAIEMRVHSDSIRVRALSDSIYLDVDRRRAEIGGWEILEEMEGKQRRGLQEVLFRIPVRYLNDSTDLVWYTGSQWRKLSGPR